VGPATEQEQQFETFGMETFDLKALTAADEPAFRVYVATALAALSERDTALSDTMKMISKEVAANREQLIQIDLKGTHGLGDLRDRVAAHEKWFEELREGLSDHASNCPMFEQMATVDAALHALAEDNAARKEMLKGFDDLKRKVDTLVVSAAETAGAKGQRESDWRTTLIMIGMALSALFSLIGLFKKGVP
jgi:hypothetical protein